MWPRADRDRSISRRSLSSIPPAFGPEGADPRRGRPYTQLFQSRYRRATVETTAGLEGASHAVLQEHEGEADSRDGTGRRPDPPARGPEGSDPRQGRTDLQYLQVSCGPELTVTAVSLEGASHPSRLPSGLKVQTRVEAVPTRSSSNLDIEGSRLKPPQASKEPLMQFFKSTKVKPTPVTAPAAGLTRLPAGLKVQTRVKAGPICSTCKSHVAQS